MTPARIGLLILSSTLTLTLSACGGSSSSDPILYTVNTDAGAGGGIAPESAEVEAGASTTFTLTPDEGFLIESASGCSGTLEGEVYTTANLDADCTVTATFTEEEPPAPTLYTVSTDAGTGGSISPASTEVKAGASTAFTLTPGEGFLIDSASGCAGTLEGTVYTTGSVDADCTVTVTFMAEPTLPLVDGSGNVSVCFATETQTHSWETRANTGSVTAQLGYADETLTIDPEWISDSDELAVDTAVDGTVTLADKTLSAQLHIDEAYITEGNLRYQWLFEDINGTVGSLLVGGPGTAGLNELTASLGDTWTGSGDLSFNEVVRIGLLFESDGDNQLPDAPLALDCFTIENTPEPEPEPTMLLDVDVTSGWQLEGDATNLAYTEDGLQFEPTTVDGRVGRYHSGLGGDFRGATMTLVYAVDQAFIDSGADLQSYFQEQYTWADHRCTIENADLVTGEQTHQCTISDHATFDVPPGDSWEGIAVRVQAINATPAGTVSVYSFTLTSPN